MPWQEGNVSMAKDHSQSGSVAAIYAVTALSTLIVMIRLYARWFLIKGYTGGLDDWIILVGQVSFSIRPLLNRTGVYSLPS